MLKCATFHTTTGAMQFEKQLKNLNLPYAMKPIPRTLSAGCGLCVEFEAELSHLSLKDVDKIFRLAEQDYTQIFP